jgi:hypothetical protein
LSESPKFPKYPGTAHYSFWRSFLLMIQDYYFPCSLFQYTVPHPFVIAPIPIQLPLLVPFHPTQLSVALLCFNATATGVSTWRCVAPIKALAFGGVVVSAEASRTTFELFDGRGSGLKLIWSPPRCIIACPRPLLIMFFL